MAIDNDLKITKKEGESFDPIPEGTYQVQVVDIKEKDSETKWGVKHKFQFNCAIVEGEYAGRLVFVSANVSWFPGGNGNKPSTLYKFVQTIYAHYHKDIKVQDMEGITGAEINDLIGKQFIALVKLSEDGKYNNVTEYLKIKSPIDYTYERKEDNQNEDVDPDDIPF